MDIESIETPYDLIETTIDKAKTTARPIAWNEEIVDGSGHIADGSLAIPTEFESSCPHCSQMIIFEAGFSEIKCPECGRGIDVKIFIEAPFQDPGKYGEETALEAVKAIISEDDAWEPSDEELDSAVDAAMKELEDLDDLDDEEDEV